MIDIKRLIAEVAARDGIRVEPGDPAFALVTLNQLMLEDAAEQIREHIRAGVAEFTEAVRKTEARAGRLLAEEVKDAAAELRRELEQDIENRASKRIRSFTPCTGRTRKSRSSGWVWRARLRQRDCFVRGCGSGSNVFGNFRVTVSVEKLEVSLDRSRRKRISRLRLTFASTGPFH